MSILLTLDITKETVEAYGHPDECTEPATGTVSQYQSETNNVTVTNSAGQSSRLATRADARLQIPSHSHDYDSIDGCHNSAEHTLLPDSDKDSQSVTINGSPVFFDGNEVTSDPKSNGNVSVTNEVNTSVTQ